MPPFISPLIILISGIALIFGLLGYVWHENVHQLTPENPKHKIGYFFTSFASQSVYMLIMLTAIIVFVINFTVNKDTPNQNYTPANTSITPATTPVNNVSATYADSKDMDVATYITAHSFTINGNGSVTFLAGEVTIRGGRATLQGYYQIMGTKSVRITNLQATDGEFDASNNEDSHGIFTFNSDGSLSGTLTAGSNSRFITFTPL